MDVSRIRALRGPNLWSRQTAIEAVVACQGPENNLDLLPDFETHLRALFPDIPPLRPVGHKTRFPWHTPCKRLRLDCKRLQAAQLHLDIPQPRPKTACFKWWWSTPKSRLAG